MIRFPETAEAEWLVVAAAARAEHELEQRLAHDVEVAKATEALRIRHEATLLHQQELDAEGTPELEMTSLADFLTDPAQTPTDLIDGVMKEHSLCVVIGPSGSGKSTLSLQMLHSLMTGQDWLGQPVRQIKGGVGLMSYDMDCRMLLDWMSGFPNIDPTRVGAVNAYRHGNPLAVPAQRQAIVEDWRAREVDVVVIDSFSASFFGHDQNDAAATMAHYRDLKKFALTEVGAGALIVIAHSTDGTPTKVRGSTVHKDTADTMVVVVPDLNTGLRTVSIEKYRAARGQVMMTPVVVTAPDDVTHLVDLDLGAMALAGMTLPPRAAAMAFPELPEPNETPEGPEAGSEESDEG